MINGPFGPFLLCKNIGNLDFDDVHYHQAFYYHTCPYPNMVDAYSGRIFALMPVLKRYRMDFFDKDEKECASILTSNGMHGYDAELYGRIIKGVREYIKGFVGESRPENVVKFSAFAAEQLKMGINEILPLLYELNQAWWVTNYVVPYGSDRNEDREMWFYNEMEGITDHFDRQGLSSSEVWIDGPRYHAVPRTVYCNERFHSVRTAFIMSITSEDTTLLLPDTLENIQYMETFPRHRPKNLRAVWVDGDSERFVCRDGSLYMKPHPFYNPSDGDRLWLSPDLRNYRGSLIMG